MALQMGAIASVSLSRSKRAAHSILTFCPLVVLQAHIATTIGDGTGKHTAALGLTNRKSLPYILTIGGLMDNPLRLPDGLQRTVCDQGLKLNDFLYTIFWPDGSWYVSQSMCRMLPTAPTQRDGALGTSEHSKPSDRSLITYNDSPTFSMLAKQIIGSQNNQTLDLCGSTEGGGSGSPVTVTVTTTLDRSGATGLSLKPGADSSEMVAIVGGTLGGALGLVLLAGILAAVYVRKRILRHRCTRDSDVPEDMTSLVDSSTRSPRHTATGAVTASTSRPSGPGMRQPPLSRAYECSPIMHATVLMSFQGDSSPGARSMATSERPLISPEASYALSSTGDGTSAGLDAGLSHRRYRSVLPFSAPRDNMEMKNNREPSQGNTSIFSMGPEVRERDAGSVIQGSPSLPPEYRTVYSA